MDSTLAIGEVAEMIGVSVPTVRRTTSQLGLFNQRKRGGHRRFAPGDVQLLVGRLGMTPELDGFTAHEVKVLAAFARQPVGFRSARAVARASRVSPTTAITAIDTLSQHGLVRAEIETVAEGSARDLTVYRLNPGTEWSRVAPAVSRTIPPNTVEAQPAPSRVPRRFWHLFWNIEPSRLRLPAQEQFVANRMLLSHDPTAWAWAAQNLSESAINSVRNSRGVDGPTGAMIDNLLGNDTLNGVFEDAKVQFLWAAGQTVLAPTTRVAGMDVGSIDDILATKVKVVGDRAELRDYFDLMEIEQQARRFVEEGLQLYMARFSIPASHSSITHIIKGFGYFDDLMDDPYLEDEHGPNLKERVIKYWQGRQPQIISSFDPYSTQPTPPRDTF